MAFDEFWTVLEPAPAQHVTDIFMAGGGGGVLAAVKRFTAALNFLGFSLGCCRVFGSDLAP